MILKNKNIELKEINSYHQDELAEWRSSQDAYDYFFEWESISCEKQEAWFSKYKNNPKEILFIIQSVFDGWSKLFGTIGLSNIDNRNRRAELSRFFIVKEERGKGIGDDTINVLIDYAKNHLNLRRLYCSVLKNNEKAIRFYENHLFKKEGILIAHVFKNGEYLDVQNMGKIL